LRLAFWRSSCILLVSIIGAALTLNTFYPLVLTGGIITFTVWSKFNFKLSYSVLPAPVINGLFSLGWIILIVLISWINFSRRANDMVFHLKDIRNYSPELGLFPKTVGDQYSLEDLSRLYRLMKNENCLYVGDMMFFYSLTDRPNPWPVIHLHDGTSYNSRDSVSYAETRSMLVKNLVKYKTALLIQDILVWGPEPFVQFAYQLKGKVRQRIGNLIVYEIDNEKLAWMASNLNIILDK
jgi:hypothetical protein